MLISIITGAPIWVWPLLVLLILLGLNSTRNRSAPVFLIYALPLLGLLSIRSVYALPASSTDWIVFAAAYLTGVTAGFRFQRGIVVEKTGARVTLKGEWVTFTVIMVIFWMNFAGGVINAISSATYGSSGFHMVFALLAGLAAGSFVGRALRVAVS